MALKALAAALGAILATSATASIQSMPTTGAPEGTPQTRYCLRVDPNTGSRMETIQCRTREEWALLEVDVDQEWAENGVRVIAA
ncbi:MAG TPA: hypothetical protein VF067_04105 [Sphingomicrobium sp.]